MDQGRRPDPCAWANDKFRDAPRAARISKDRLASLEGSRGAGLAVGADHKRVPQTPFNHLIAYFAAKSKIANVCGIQVIQRQ